MQNPQILILEDEAITSDHIVRTLQRLGYEVAGVAANGTTALEMIEQTKPDLLLADIGLEGDLDGIEVAARAHEEWNIPTVYLTAYSDPETLRRARITEPYGYVIKPFADQELHAAVEIALQQKTLRAQRDFEATKTAQTLVRTQDELSAVTARLFEVQEQERAAIARDLHDGVGQQLALLQIQFESLLQKVPGEIGNQHRSAFENAIQRLAELSDTVRNMSHRLHPAVLDDLGLAAAVRHLSEEFEERHLIPTRFSARGVPDSLKPEISVALYRITQEALQNIAKHAGRAPVNIALVGTDSTMELSIRDNGKGFDPHDGARHRGLGLISMVERAAALGGKIKIDSEPGEGTRIHVSMPLTVSASAASASKRQRN